MIQACSRCGTRWNVRDRRRDVCPRCGGALLAPVAGAAPQQNRPAQGARIPAGYRWIAVRPGAAPRGRRIEAPLGQTPHYNHIPQWGLRQEFDDAAQEAAAAVRTGPSPRMVRTAMAVAAGALGAAALMHVVRYILLLINRTVLLNRWVALASSWFGVVASVVAVFAVATVALVLINWLVARRSVAYERAGETEPRRRWWLRVASLVPVLNLFWAPVFVLELATVENRLRTLRRPIITWWCVWAVATVISVWSIATSFTTDPQGIADNTVLTTLAYLAGLGALVYANRVYLGFEGADVVQSGHRWLPTDTESAVPVEPVDEEPAA